MYQNKKDIQRRYDGFLQTSSLLKDDAIFGLHPFYLRPNHAKIDIEVNEKLRLGKYVERFVSYQFQKEPSIAVIAENIQIQKEKITMGELDCIILKDAKVIHLEIIYKFYVFDPEFGINEIDHFIGPNRKDSLIEKLTKLYEKQLPLLYSTECLEYLKSMNLQHTNIEQQVYFKAQLFIPFDAKELVFEKINEDCISGFYINRSQMQQFSYSKFYVPIKKDWLIEPHQYVNWLNFNEFTMVSQEYLQRNFSPLCWLKHPNGEIEKFFLVWW